MIITDIILPGLDGRDLCRELRKAKIQTPLLMLTALGGGQVEHAVEEERLYVNGNLYLMKIAFQNIVENACKFSPDHTAKVAFTSFDRKIEIRISDTGPGIDKNDLENVFQPFYRADRTSRINGHGVGLSLSQRIIHIHKAL